MQESVLDPVFFSLFISDRTSFLPFQISCSLYADDLAIWSSSPYVSAVVKATQEALIQQERCSKHQCLPLDPSMCRASFLVDARQANL